MREPGVVVIGSPHSNDDKLYGAARLGALVEALDGDGAIVSTEGFGNNHIDFAACIAQIGSREIPAATPAQDLKVSHGGFDNSDVNRDINAMFPIERLRELAAEGIIGAIAPTHIGFMGGGGNVERFRDATGPTIARLLQAEGVDVAVFTGGCGTCHRSAVLVQRAVEAAGIATVIIAALPPIAQQEGAPRITAPHVPIGANAGEPGNAAMQRGILLESLRAVAELEEFGVVKELAYGYRR